MLQIIIKNSPNNIVTFGKVTVKPEAHTRILKDVTSIKQNILIRHLDSGKHVKILLDPKIFDCNNHLSATDKVIFENLFGKMIVMDCGAFTTCGRLS